MGIRHLLITVFLFGSLTVFAQSHETIEKNGEKFYIHTVEEGNTLYAISKLYGVDVPYIKEANDGLDEGLKIGQQILIPLKFRDKKFTKKPQPKLDGNYIVHTVAKKETVYSISKKYSISMNDLLDANPGVGEVIKKGQQLVIPMHAVKVQDEQVLEVAKQDSLMHHVVKKGETLYAISKIYEVSIDDIVEVNNGLTNTIKEGMTLRIPLPIPEVADDEGSEKEGEEVEFEEIEVKKIALLLPFEPHKVDSSDTYKRKSDAFAMIDLAVEFYRGAKLACDEFGRGGGNVDLMVLNMGNDENEAKKMVQAGILDDIDVVIGPFHKKVFTTLSEELNEQDQILVSPNLRSGSISQLEDVIRVSPDRLAELEYIAEEIALNHYSDNILVIRSENKRDKALTDAMIAILNNRLERVEDRFIDQVKVVTLDEEGPKEKRTLVLQNELMKDTANVFIAPSNNVSFASDVVSKLNRSILDEFDISVYGLESWIKFDNIDLKSKEDLNLRISASKNLDYNSTETRNFMRTYFQEHNSIPSDKGYAFLAYDISKFVLAALDQYGNKAYETLDGVNSDSIYQNFNFVKNELGAWENHGYYLLSFKDFKLVKVD